MEAVDLAETTEIIDPLVTETTEPIDLAETTEIIDPLVVEITEIQDAVDLVKILTTTPPANLTAAEIQTQINEALSQLSNLENTQRLIQHCKQPLLRLHNFHPTIIWRANTPLENQGSGNKKVYEVDANGSTLIDPVLFNPDGTPLTQEIADALQAEADEDAAQAAATKAATPEIQDAVDLVKTLSTAPPANLTAEEIRIQIDEALQPTCWFRKHLNA